MTGKRIADFGIRVGSMEPGPRDKITDVPGVRVGQVTLRDGRINTGVTVIMPCEDNMFSRKLVAASHVQNGFGKTCGLVQIDELGTLETPIALTNTLNVGLVSDALVSYMTERCAQEHIPIRSLNPVVGETNDANINDILLRSVHEEHVLEAIRTASQDFEEGDAGAGTGTVCHGLKGGIGSASRVIPIAGKNYTLGILVQSNYGCLEELNVCGRRVGREILEARNRKAEEEAKDQGSIMVIAATDLPVTDRQLKRILRRCAAGLARCGSYFGHGSGDVMIGFSTENRVPTTAMDCVLNTRTLTEPSLEKAFKAAAEATEEAILNSLAAASPAIGLNGQFYDSLSNWL